LFDKLPVFQHRDQIEAGPGASAYLKVLFIESHNALQDRGAERVSPRAEQSSCAVAPRLLKVAG
jgi:hypothetical protein